MQKLQMTNDNSNYNLKEEGEKKLAEGVKTTKITKPATITSIEFTDWQNKPLYYLKIEINGKELLLNVGKKTTETIKNMANEPEATQGNRKP